MKKNNFLKHILIGGATGGIIIGGIYAIIIGYSYFYIIVRKDPWLGLAWIAISRVFNPIYKIMEFFSINFNSTPSGYDAMVAYEKNFYLVSTFISVIVGVIVGVLLGLFIRWCKDIKIGKNK